MLTEDQISEVWDDRIAAEVRSLYFGDLANRYSTQKQWITGLSFFFSSAAAASLLGKLPVWCPLLLSLAVAVMSAYSVAVNLDSKIKTMANLHCSWSQIGLELRRLWNHVYRDDAEADFDELQRRQLELSEIAVTEAPNDEKRMSRWQLKVFQLHGLKDTTPNA